MGIHINDLTTLASSNIPKSALDLIQKSTTSLEAFVDAQNYLVGNSIWWKSAEEDAIAFSDWLDAFEARIEGATIAESKITEAERNELLATIRDLKAHFLTIRLKYFWN